MKHKRKRAVERVLPRQQRNWDWRAAANFILGGAGGGLLALCAPAAAVGAGATVIRAATVLGLLLIGTGLTSVWFEIGRPWRALNVFRHVKTSWMTREAFVALTIFPIGAAAIVSGSLVVQWACSLLGLLFIYCQARILSTNKGIPAWRHPRSVPLVLTTGLTEGAGLLACVVALSTLGVGSTGSTLVVSAVAVSLLALVSVRIVCWRAYIAGLQRDGAPEGTMTVWSAMEWPFLLAGGGLPLLAAAAALVMARSGISEWTVPILLGGMLAVAAGWWFKHALVLRAAFTQGIALKHLPTRGAGPAGAGIKPGWRAPAARGS